MWLIPYICHYNPQFIFFQPTFWGYPQYQYCYVVVFWRLCSVTFELKAMKRIIPAVFLVEIHLVQKKSLYYIFWKTILTRLEIHLSNKLLMEKFYNSNKLSFCWSLFHFKKYQKFLWICSLWGKNCVSKLETPKPKLPYWDLPNNFVWLEILTVIVQSSVSRLNKIFTTSMYFQHSWHCRHFFVWEFKLKKRKHKSNFHC